MKGNETYRRCTGREYSIKETGEANPIGEKKSLKRRMIPTVVLRWPSGINLINLVAGFRKPVSRPLCYQSSYEQESCYPHGRETNRPIASTRENHTHRPSC